MDLWQEFEAATTPEAKFSQALDKLEAAIQHNEADLKTWNETERSAWGLMHGDQEAAYSPILKLFKGLVTAESKAKLSKGGLPVSEVAKRLKAGGS